MFAGPPETTGCGRQALRLAQALVRKGVEAFFLTRTKIGMWLPTYEKRNGFGLYRIPLRARNAWECYAAWIIDTAILTLLDWKYDILHCHGITLETVAPALLASIRKKPVILKISQLGMDDPITLYSNKRHRFYRRVFEQAHAIIAMSPFIAEICLYADIPEEKLWQIPNGVDTAKFAPCKSQGEKRALRRLMGVNESATIAVFVGRVYPRKGVHFLLEAWREVAVRCPHSQLILVGETTRDPDYVSKIKSMAQSINDGTTVKIVGHSEQVDSFLKIADIFVLSSYREGLSNAVLEAMSCGLPCVVSNIPEMASLVRHGETGLLVDPQNTVEFVEAMCYLIENPKVRLQMGQNARETVLSKFSLDRIADRYIDLYIQLKKSLR